ncbi:MAG TPA: CBS domain-containing protein [Gaiella sp.]|nr:CBS domain-containing protein [Gaiella sp.]
MRVRDVMSTPPLSVHPSTTLRNLAALLIEHRVSGVPVVMQGHVVGVVSAADVVDRERGPDVESRTLRSRLLRRQRRRAVTATTVGEAMTSPPITIDAWMSVYEAAWLMSTYGVGRLPVLDRDLLVGVITRTDLVRCFARSDAEIERDVREKIGVLEAPQVLVASTHGRVALDGEVGSELERRCLPHLVSSVPGVVDVECRVGVRGDRPQSAPVAASANGEGRESRPGV